jgi:uncharacterized Zn finger protein
MWWSFRPYVSVPQRRANALREVKKLAKKGRIISPVEIAGRTIASTFWGKAWCDHLESFSDFSNRLPRGRTYARNGSVVDLQIEAGKITALVSGSSLYNITIKIKPLAASCWENVKSRCGGQIGSMVELLQGKLSKSVMEIVTGRDGGMFPLPREIEMSCSCPDYADMCKHVAATLYGVGNRLDHQPELLFKLRHVDHLELIASGPGAVPQGARKKTIAADQLADVFGIEMQDFPAGGPPPVTTNAVKIDGAKAAPVSIAAGYGGASDQPIVGGKRGLAAAKRRGRRKADPISVVAHRVENRMVAREKPKKVKADTPTIATRRKTTNVALVNPAKRRRSRATKVEA